MLRFALKNMAIKKIQIILVVISIVISAGVGVLAYNIGEQVSDGITGNAGYYGAIIGPDGSETQLAMNTMYFAEEPLGTIPYSVVTDLKMDTRVTSAIPFAMADSYNGYSCVGTTNAFLDGKDVSEGRLFDDSTSLEVTVGYNVAKTCDLKVGDQIYTGHSALESHHTPLTVVGILEQTHTSYDNIVFTQLKTLWDVHEEGHAGETEEEHEDHAQGHTVCAVLVKLKNPGAAAQLVNEYDGKVVFSEDGDSFQLQAIEPMDAVRGVLEDADNTKYIVFALCAIILAMNVVIISVITLLNMYHSAKEISLMRLIGIGMRKINLLYIIQNGIIGLVSTILAFLMSRVCLIIAGDYVSSMGVILRLWQVYPLEIIILIAIFVISVFPTVICTSIMSRKDGLSD